MISSAIFFMREAKWVQSVQERNESFSIDEQDAILFQYIIANLIQSLQQSISVVSSLIRIFGDTLAGVMSGMVKATGGLLNLASKVLYYVSAKLEATQEHSPAFLGNFSSNCAFGLKQAAPILHYAGEACIYSGEILESMTLGLGEAVQDSFWGLEVVSNSSNVIISFLLQIDEVDSIASMRKRIAQIARPSLPNSSSDDTVASETAPVTSLTNANTTHSSSPARHIRNILHTRPHIELNTHVVDPHHKQHSSSLEVKLGKQWIAPDAAVISIHDAPDTATNILTDDPTTDNKEYTSYPTHNYTTYNATNLVLKVRHVWNILVNKTSSIAKQLTNHTQGVYLADATDISITPEEGTDLDDGMVDPILPVTNNYTYIVQELPQLITEYLVYTLSLSYRILQSLTILSIQLYTAVVAAQQTESSQGAFFLLALLATYIISVIPFQSMRRKILTLLFFITLVYCSFITTEQIQRGKLIHNISVQSAHDLLLQQAQQRHHRRVNPKLYDNVIRDSSSIYTGTGNDYAEISVNGDVYVHSEDVITVPHYEHTPTQDVYSNINHHHTNQHDPTRTTPVTNTSQSIPEDNNNTTTAFLFDDAIWLNTLLTSLWVINDAHFNTHGLGAYLNEVYAEYVNIELNNIPPSVANIRLKSFDLGRAAPLFKGVRVFRVRDHVCMKQRINNEFNVGTRDSTSSPVRTDSHTDQNNASTGANDSISSLQAHDTILANLWQSIENWGANTSRSNNTSESIPDDSNNDGDSKGSMDSSEASDVPTNAATDPTTPATATPILPSSSTPATVHSALLAPYKHLLSQFNAECDSLIIEMDTIFLSSDMNIVLSLRQALKSALPEITATLSEVSLSGQLRLKVKLTPDYPFVGDGQLSFLSAPQLGFSLNSLGGIELSSVPYAFYWVNSSMHYVLEQYTAPKYMELDLRHTLCATCDLPLVPAHDIVKVLKSSVSTAVERLKQAAVKARALWAKMDQSGRKWTAHLHRAWTVAQHHLQQGVHHVQQTIDAHTARTLRAQDSSSRDGGSGGDNSGDSGEGFTTRKGEGGKERALHFSRYKSFDTIEESDMHPELKSEEKDGRNGGRVLISQASALWRKGQTKLKEAMQNIGNDRSVNELVYML